jgi:hypothetical protein
MRKTTIISATSRAVRYRTAQTFPFVTLPGRAGGLPVEVCLVACLSPGSGNKLFHGVLARQMSHGEYVDELDEPSAKLGGTDFARGDATALYSFGVGHRGHPFHRHAGQRIFTAISGSSGAQLRFSTATPDDIEQDPSSFVRALRIVTIPPDCFFTVRFGGETWHQFLPLDQSSTHPAFFALSCHTNELGGDLSDEMRQRVRANQADIPSLTELLPDSVLTLLKEMPLDPNHIPTTSLFLDAAPGGLLQRACVRVRSVLGRICGAWAHHRRPTGYILEKYRGGDVLEHLAAPSDSLLQSQLSDRTVNHEDHFTLTLSADELAVPASSAQALLAKLLEGFLSNQPAGVTRLMRFRNTLVRPLKLRTSALGCPVSSLLSDAPCDVFSGRYPVLAQQVGADDRCAQVILGADDRHLVFRSCAAVRLLPEGRVEFSLSTRVACKNLFGRAYMAAISQVHRRYITPAMLRNAVSVVLR